MEIEPTRVTDPEFYERSGYATGTFLGERATACKEDLVPVKNHLPAKLGILLKTRRQWEDFGFTLLPTATPYALHSTSYPSSKNIYVYYHEDDVAGAKDDPDYIAYKARLIADLEEAAGSGGLAALAQRRYEKAAADTNLPIKNELPEDEKNDFHTRNQWAEHGCRPKRFAEPVLMRPSKGRKPCRYYRTADVEFIDEDWAKTCYSCSIRHDSYYCPIAGGKIGRNTRCSEWEPRY